VQDPGYLFIVFDPILLMHRDDFKAQCAELIGRIKGTPRAFGTDEIRIPSERAFRERERQRVEGMLIPPAVHDKLKALAGA
jgi:LDH2 family malate/lactate/ureidoglycolate dehydrogenase